MIMEKKKMKITVYDCTQKSLIGYSADINYSDLLENKSVELHKGENTYYFGFDTVKRVGPKRFKMKNSNMSIWFKN